MLIITISTIQIICGTFFKSLSSELKELKKKIELFFLSVPLNPILQSHPQLCIIWQLWLPPMHTHQLASRVHPADLSFLTFSHSLLLCPRSQLQQALPANLRAAPTRTTSRLKVNPLLICSSRDPIPLVRKAKINNTHDSLCWQGCEPRGTLHHC